MSTRGTTETEAGGGGDYPTLPGIMVTGLIGQGGQGIVYRAKQQYLDRVVAVKMMHLEFCDEYFAARFQREAKILAGMTHPNIVSCHDAGTIESGQCYLVMEFVDGQNLAQYLKDHGPLEPGPAVRLAKQIAEALRHAYREKIIHRDVKPENILLKREKGFHVDPSFPYRACVVDLGLARAECDGPAGSDLTARGHWQGTPATMAPEQFDNPEGVDCRADMYGLGCVLFNALTGQKAFYGSTTAAVIASKMRNEPPDVNKLRPTIPKYVSQLVHWLVAKDRDERPESYDVLIDKCDEVSRRLVAGDKGTRSGLHVKEPRRNRALLVGAALLIAGVGTLGLLEFTGIGGSSTRSEPGNDPDQTGGPSEPVRRELVDFARVSFGASTGLEVPLSAQEQPEPWICPTPLREGEEIQFKAVVPSGASVVLRWSPQGDLDGAFTVLDDRSGFCLVPPDRREDYSALVHLDLRGAPEGDRHACLEFQVRADDDPVVFTPPDDQAVDEGERVLLVGSAMDPEGESLSVRWRQARGPAQLELALMEDEGGGGTARATVEVPTGTRARSLEFELVATDSSGKEFVSDKRVQLSIREPVLNLSYMSQPSSRKQLFSNEGGWRDHWRSAEGPSMGAWGRVPDIDRVGKGRSVNKEDGRTSWKSLPLPRGAWRFEGTLSPKIYGRTMAERAMPEGVMVRVEFANAQAVALCLDRAASLYEVRVEHQEQGQSGEWKSVRTLCSLPNGGWGSEFEGQPRTYRDLYFQIAWRDGELSIETGDSFTTLQRVKAGQLLDASFDTSLPQMLSLVVVDGEVHFWNLLLEPGSAR